MSDREISNKTGFSRTLVKMVRFELIFAKQIPGYVRGKFTPYYLDAYKPGSVVRGGYVMDETGKVIRDSEWKKRQKAAGRSK